MTRRTLLNLACLAPLARAADGPTVNVYKTATCGCCAKWVQHLQTNGFNVVVRDVPSTAEYRQKYGVPDKLASCHTATVGAYSIEGHVPAREIHRLLKSGVKSKGLAVPNMPLGSPGMEAGRSDAYSVLLFEADGRTSVYASYPAQ